jgi:hypothetical protein
VQGRSDVVQVWTDVVKGSATRRRPQNQRDRRDRRDRRRNRRSPTKTDTIYDETDDETDGEASKAGEVDFSSVQREPAAGDVAQRGAERLKNSGELVRFSKNST